MVRVVVRCAETRDRGAAKLAGDAIGMAELDAVPIGRRFAPTWPSWHHPPGRSVSRCFSAGQNDAPCPAVLMFITRFLDGGTQWMVLSATVDKRRSQERYAGTGRCLQGADGAIVRNSTKCHAFDPTTHATSHSFSMTKCSLELK